MDSYRDGAADAKPIGLKKKDCCSFIGIKQENSFSTLIQYMNQAV